MTQPGREQLDLEPDGLALFVRGLDRTGMERLVTAWSRAVVNELPEITADPSIRECCADAMRQNVHCLVTVGMCTLTEGPPVLTPGHLAASRMLMERAVEVSRLSKAYRVAHSAFWDAWMTVVEQSVSDSRVQMSLLKTSWGRSCAWIDAQSELMAEIYLEELGRWLRGEQARRTEMVRSILRNDPVDAGRAGNVLGIDLHGWITAIEAWSEGVSPHHRPLCDLIHNIRTSLHRAKTLTVPVGPSTSRVWISTEAKPGLDQLRAAIVPVGDRLHVACGRPARGPRGFRVSSEDAALARRVASRTSTESRAAFYDDQEMLAILSGEPAAMQRFVVHELAGLGRLDDHGALLRRTVLCFLENGLNARAAAEVLFTHKNTVHYRLERAAALLGHPISARRLELEMALRIVATYGDAILDVGEEPEGDAECGWHPWKSETPALQEPVGRRRAQRADFGRASK